MNKEDFFNELKECLEGEVSEAEYRDSLSYYRDYFKEQEMLGKTEQEILSELGDARLIAHSIIDAHGLEKEVARPQGYYDEYTADNYSSSYEDPHEEIVNDPQPGPLDHLFSSIGRVVLIIAVLLVAGIALNLLLPVFVVIIAIVVIMSLFGR